MTAVEQGAMRHVHHTRVRYGEVDMQGVVFNAHYLAYCDDASDQWFRALDLIGPHHGWDVMLKKAVIEWQGPAGVGDDLAISIGVDRFGTTSFDVGFVGTVGERPVFTATITYVGVDVEHHRPMPMPPDVRARLEAASA